jgi:hypothetical protein
MPGAHGSDVMAVGAPRHRRMPAGGAGTSTVKGCALDRTAAVRAQRRLEEHSIEEDAHAGRHQEGAGHQTGHPQDHAGAQAAETSPLDCLLHALDDLACARDQAQQDARAGIDSAVERIRDVRKSLTPRAMTRRTSCRRGSSTRPRRRCGEFGRAAIRAQWTPVGLAQMQAEIRARKRKLLV